MNIMGITDLHGLVDSLERVGKALSEADLVILSGDITHFGAEREAKTVIEAVLRFNGKVYAVPGNCDYPGVLAFLENEGMSLHRRAVTFEDHVIAGLGGSLPCPGMTPNEFSEEEFENFLEELEKSVPAGKPFVFVSHQPPRNTVCDLAGGRTHVGSPSVRSFIQKTLPLVCFSGHIHEAVGIDSIGDTRVVNPGPLKTESYALAAVSDRLERLEIVRGGKTVMGR
jgi:Icc-related predicted phosphoesterase